MSNKLSEKAQHDLGLIERAKKGDQKAYKELMDRYYNSIYHEILVKVRDAEQAQDLTIEAISKAFIQLHTYEPRFAFSTWLKRVSVNHVIDYLRKKKLSTVSIDETIGGEDGEMTWQFPAETADPEESMEKKERLAIVREYVSTLKDAYRNLIELRYFKELSYEEIAVQLAIPIGTVKARLHRAKGMLNQMMVPAKGTF